LKTLNILILAVAICIAVSSCTTRIYPPALFQNDIQLMEKPHSTDEQKSATYVSGSYLLQDNMASYGALQSGLLNIYHSETVPNINYSYGVLGFAGTFTRDSTNTIIDNKAFMGLGVNGSVSYYKNYGKIDWRIVGMDAVYTKEFGDYLAFRKAVAQNPDVITTTQSGLFSFAIFSEVIGKPSPDVNIGGRLFFSKTAGRVNRDLQRDSFLDDMAGITGFVGYKRVSGHLTLTSTRAMFYSSMQIGLSYKL
jgi:hypothetical protein